MQAGDEFLKLSGTGWVAVGSISGACSILVLSVLNYLSLKAAQAAAAAAHDQASAAQRSLVILESQLSQQELLEKQTAIEVLFALSRTASQWEDKLHVEYQGEVRLFPDQWVGVTKFSATLSEPLRFNLRVLERETAQTENLLVEYMHWSPQDRKAAALKTDNLTDLLRATARGAGEMKASLETFFFPGDGNLRH